MLLYIHIMPTRWRWHEIGEHWHAGLRSCIQHLRCLLQVMYDAHELLVVSQVLLVLSHEIGVCASGFQPSLLHLGLNGNHFFACSSLASFNRWSSSSFIIFFEMRTPTSLCIVIRVRVPIHMNLSHSITALLSSQLATVEVDMASHHFIIKV